jgi:2,3-bisphosphoglycerate-dependent phosphoglycerate mutase
VADGVGEQDGAAAAGLAAAGAEADPEDDPFLGPATGGTELYLIRHGDALPDAEELQQGDYDAQYLSELGRRQAEALAERLADTRFDAIYTSPLRRTRQTAEPLSKRLGLLPETVDDLREVGLGQLGPSLPEGASPTEVLQAMREHLHALGRHAARVGSWEGVPGAEPRAAFRERVRRAHDALAARHPGGRIACFSHIATINVYLAEVLGIERDFFVPLANTSISIVRVRAPRRMALAINDVSHLRAAGLLRVPGS